jgi:LmbE family N-acetylglucosaminyl deacetylase/NDP-sugar pyrophosphorylase family protein
MTATVEGKQDGSEIDPALRLLIVVPHPDDEAFFLGGTIAYYARRGVEVSVIVLTDGELGKAATYSNQYGGYVAQSLSSGMRDGFVIDRKRESQLAARLLGVKHIEFLGFADSQVTWRIHCHLQERIEKIDPHVIISLSEAGIYPNPDHSEAAVATMLAIRSTLRSQRRHEGGLLPSKPHCAFRRYLTFISRNSSKSFDKWSELDVPEEECCRVDIADLIELKRDAGGTFRTQAHWMQFLEKVGHFEIGHEEFHERISLLPTCHGTGDLFHGIHEELCDLRFSAFPYEPVRYQSSRSLGRIGCIDSILNCRLSDLDSMWPIVLASGFGKRLKSHKPKSLITVGTKPLIDHTLEFLVKSILPNQPVVVIGPQGEQIIQNVRTGVVFVEQSEPRGTAHAVACCRTALQDRKAKHVLVVCGDMPFIRTESINNLVMRHLQGRSVITMGTVCVPHFSFEYGSFAQFGRIARDEGQNIVGIVEYHDADSTQRQITEINPSVFCFSTDWLWGNVGSLDDRNSQQEYYLTDLVSRAREQGHLILSSQLTWREAIGINTQADLAFANEIWARDNKSSQYPFTVTMELSKNFPTRGCHDLCGWDAACHADF